MQTITIDGDLHLKGNLTLYDPEGVPVSYIVRGELRPQTEEVPARGEYINGDLRIQGGAEIIGASK